MKSHNNNWSTLLTEKQRSELPAEYQPKRSRVINRAYVKSWAIDYAASNRCHQFTRVSEEFLNAVESYTKEFIRDRINRTPSKGVTLK